MPKADRQIYRLFAACIVMAVVSLIVPRFVSNPEGGFAGAASAVLALLILLGLTLLFSLYLLAITIQKYDSLSLAARIAGIAPGVVLTATLLWLFWFLNY